MFVIKTDDRGVILWNQTYQSGLVLSIIQTSDVGFAITGCSQSIKYVEHNLYDVSLIKTNKQGMIEWNRSYGGLREDIGQIIIQTLDA